MSKTVKDSQKKAKAETAASGEAKDSKQPVARKGLKRKAEGEAAPAASPATAAVASKDKGQAACRVPDLSGLALDLRRSKRRYYDALRREVVAAFTPRAKQLVAQLLVLKNSTSGEKAEIKKANKEWAAKTLKAQKDQKKEPICEFCREQNWGSNRVILTHRGKNLLLYPRTRERWAG